MTSAAWGAAESSKARHTWVATTIAVLALLGVTWWAAGAGPDEPVVPSLAAPATVEHIGHTDFSWVTLTADAAQRVGLEVVAVRRTVGPVTVPYAALVHAADGTTWVYASEEADSLRFRRYQVEVGTINGSRATLEKAPPPGTFVAGAGSALLYGSEFEVGH